MALKQTNLFEDIVGASAPAAPSDPLTILQGLKGTCRNCRLGVTCDKTNEGVTYAGSPDARIAFVGDMLEVAGTMLSKRLPIAGAPLAALQGWLGEKALNLRMDDLFVINVVQCKTSKGKAKDAEIRAPFKEEIDACFPFRCLPVLQAMPNLEVVITLGWTAAGALIGREPEPRQKSHEGQWFGTDLLPGVAVFCLDHPREFCGGEVEARRIGRLGQYLAFFRSEYLNTKTSKIMQILKVRTAERTQTRAE